MMHAGGDVMMAEAKRTTPVQRILLAERNSMMGSALGILLGREPGVQVVGQTNDAHELLNAARATRPDAVLLDWDLPGWQAATMVAELLSVSPRMVLVGLCTRPERCDEVLAAGAKACLTLVDPPSKVLAVLRAVLCEASQS
jgi:two-component system, NarL family, response regulator DesR